MSEAEDEFSSSLLRGLRSGSWLDSQTFPPIQWVVPGLLPEGMSMLVGGPKLGKSWLSLDIALAVASGGPALGKVDVGAARPVLLLALEDGDRRLQERSRKLLDGKSIPPLLEYMTRIEPGMVVPTIEEWLGTLAGDDQPLVILDTLGKVMPMAAPGESSYQRDYRVSGRLKQICDARPGMALLVLHHDRKASSEDFVDGVSGTNGIAGAADTIVLLVRSRIEADGLLKVTGRDVIEAEYAVRTEDGRWSITGDDLMQAAAAATAVRATANLSDRSSEVLRFVAQRPEGVRAADVAEAVDGLSASDSRQYLKRLADAGKLRKPERGLYLPVLTSVTSVTVSRPDDLARDTRDRCDTGLGVAATPDRCSNDYAEVQHPLLCSCSEFDQ